MEINVFLIAILLLVILIILIFSGNYIAFSLMITGIISFHLFTPRLVQSLGRHLFVSANDFILLAMPLFILMGEIILHSGLSERLYRGISKITGIFPGSLLHTNILGCAIFGAISGSATATSATIGSVAIPEQTKLKYNRRMILGSILGGGGLGILIPPSIIMIIYGAFCNVSVARLFLAGVVPGLILALFFMIYIGFSVTYNKDYAPRQDSFNWGYIPKAISSIKELWPFVLIMGAVLGGIYTGQTTPTEAAAIACIMATIVAKFLGKLNLKIFQSAVASAIRTNCFIMLCVVGGRLLGVAVSMVKLPARLLESIEAANFSPLGVWAILILAYIIMGCLMEDISLMIVTLPVTFPLMSSLGFDKVWFGVQLTILIELAMITPPVGICLYVVQGIAPKNTPLTEIMMGSIPYVMLYLAGIALFTIFPNLVIWLPNLFFG